VSHRLRLPSAGEQAHRPVDEDEGAHVQDVEEGVGQLAAIGPRHSLVHRQERLVVWRGKRDKGEALRVRAAGGSREWTTSVPRGAKAG
jgi:hypothetical protein